MAEHFLFLHCVTTINTSEIEGKIKRKRFKESIEQIKKGEEIKPFLFLCLKVVSMRKGTGEFL